MYNFFKWYFIASRGLILFSILFLFISSFKYKKNINRRIAIKKGYAGGTILIFALEISVFAFTFDKLEEFFKDLSYQLGFIFTKKEIAEKEINKKLDTVYALRKRIDRISAEYAEANKIQDEEEREKQIKMLDDSNLEIVKMTNKQIETLRKEIEVLEKCLN